MSFIVSNLIHVVNIPNNHISDDCCGRTLSNTEDECAHLKELCERSQQDLKDLALKYSIQLQKVEELTSKLQVSP
jgi:hypothetical protein